MKINGLWVNMPPIGPEVIPDVFSGQILALHPLTWFLFADPALSETVGRFLRTWEFDTVAQGHDAHDCVLYWEMIGAILTAADLYRIAHDDFENRRGVHEQGGDALAAAASEDSPSAQAYMDDYIASRNLCCPCGSQYTCGTIEVAADKQESRQVPLICRSCGREDSVLVTEAEFEAYLLHPDDNSG